MAHCANVKGRSVGAVEVALLLVAFLAALPVSAKAEPKQTWHVVDRRGGGASVPVPSALVLFTYHGSDFGIGHSQYVCDDAALIKTDSNGAFEWPESRRNRTPEIVGYKRGFAHPSARYIDKQRREIVLNSTEDHQLLIEQFQYVWSATECRNIGDRNAPIKEFLDASVPDLVQIARTADEQRLLNRLEGMRQFEARRAKK